MKVRYILFSAFVSLATLRGLAQQQKLVIHFRDAGTLAPLSGVRLIGHTGTETISDSNGYATVALEALREHYLVAMRQGYKPDTIKAAETEVDLQPLSMTLKPAIVSSNKVRKLLNEGNEYVVDYAFAGERMIVATYAGNSGGKAKLFLLDKDGSTAQVVKLAAEPISLFKSCTNVIYCIFADHFTTVNTDSGKLSLGPTYNRRLLEALQQCEQSKDGNLYYKTGDRNNFRTTYGMIARGDSVFRVIRDFEEADVAQASDQEWEEILMLIATASAQNGNMSKAARKQFARLKWDRGSFAHINLPLLRVSDTLAIFDYFGRELQFYDLQGRATGSTAIKFEWRQSQQFEILKDEMLERYYLHRYDHLGKQTIEELYVCNGTVCAQKTLLDKPFAEQVRIYNGDIYFLWKEHSYSPRQLFIQKEGFAAKAIASGVNTGQ